MMQGSVEGDGADWNVWLGAEETNLLMRHTLRKREQHAISAKKGVSGRRSCVPLQRFAHCIAVDMGPRLLMF
jgi:hypothetical protein